MQDSFWEIALKIDELIKIGPVNFVMIEPLLDKEGIMMYFFKEALSKLDNPIPWLNPLEVKGFFNASKNPKPNAQQGSPYWEVMGYLENVAEKNKQKPVSDITESLINIINRVIEYRENGKRIVNFWTDYTIIKILSNTPSDFIEQKHLDFIRELLLPPRDLSFISSDIGKRFVSRLINDKAKPTLLDLLRILLDYKCIGSTLKPLMDEYWLSDMLEKNKEQIAKLCGVEAAKIALEKIKLLVEKNESAFGRGEIRTIKSTSQDEFYRSYDQILVYFVRDMYELSDAELIRSRIDELLKMKHPIFKRIAIHSINCHYSKLGELFWSLSINPLDESATKREIYELIRNNREYFGEKEIAKFHDWIGSINYSRFDYIEGKSEKEKVIESIRQFWLFALSDSLKDKEYAGIDDTGLFMGTGISDKIDENIEKYNNMTNSQISDDLKNLQKDTMSLIERSEIYDAIRSCAITHPEKFSSEMEYFKNVDMQYQSAILSGLYEAWRQGKMLNWSKLLAFSLEIIQREEFLNWIKPIYERNYKDWVISTIADLINEGTKKDDHAMDEKLLPKAEEILLFLVNNTESDVDKEEDIINTTINTAKGKIFEAIISYSLHFARINEKSKGKRWKPAIKEEFTKRLNRLFDKSLEFSVILGQFLPNLLYLDDEWVYDNIDRIFPKDNDLHWRIAFTGYLSYSRTLYKEIYSMLKEKGHYSNAITAKFADKYAMERCVQHICIGYLSDFEKIDDNESLINQLLNNKDPEKNPEQLTELINYLWRIRDNLKAQSKEKVKPLWKKMIEILTPKQNESAYREVISKTSNLLKLFDNIDDEMFELLKLSAKCSSEGYDLHNFITGLAIHVKKTPKYVGEIYIKLLESGTLPNYPEEAIQIIVENLYQEKEKEIADKICNIYGEKGLYFLKDTYVKHRENATKGDQNAANRR
jgi:hypothetical protein